MPTLNLPCTNGTFLSYVYPNSDNSGQLLYMTCSQFLRARSTDAEDYKHYLAHRDRLDQYSEHQDFGGSILEFASNPLLAYKRITGLTLHIRYEIYSTNTGEAYINGQTGSSFPYYWNEYIGKYTSAKTLSEINLYNFNLVGSFSGGSWQDLKNNIPKSVTSYDRTRDLSDCLSNNDALNTIRLIVSAGPDFTAYDETNMSSGVQYAAHYFYSQPTPSSASAERYVDPANTYIEVAYEDIAPIAPTPLSPVGMGLNPNRDITFSWQYNSDTPATQASATIQYSVRGSGVWTTLTSSGSGTSKILSGGLTVGQYEWRVCTTNSLSETSAYSAVQYFNVVAQSAPTAVYPSGGLTLMEGQDVTFTWIYNSLTPATQASATLKYKLKSAGAWTNYVSNSSNPFCTIQNLPQGNYEWKLSITNNYGETSSDSGVLEFNIIGRPQAPIILTPANCCLTTISWNADGQEAAEIMLYKNDELIIHETIATAETMYKPQMFLKGDYIVKIRIKNNSDLWSDFRTLSFTINAAGPAAGTLIAMPLDDRVKLKGTYTSTNVALVRIEDGQETVIAMTNEAIDDTVAGNTVYTYVLRSWNTGGYTDSEIKVVECGFIGSIFKGESGELHLDKSEEVFFSHGESYNSDFVAMKFYGRKYPVIETDSFTDNRLSKRFHATREQSKLLKKLTDEKSVFYRDSRGNAFKAKIEGLKFDGYLSDEYIVELTLMRTAPNEVIINV